MYEFSVFKFLLVSVHQQFHLPFFRGEHDRFFAEAAHHVEGVRGFAAERKLQRVLLDFSLYNFPELTLDLEEAVGWTQASYALVRAPVVVVFHPHRGPLPGRLERVELRTVQELLEDALPEPLDLAERHRMVRLALDVFYPVFLKLSLKLRVAAPARVLPPVVGQHLLWDAVFGHSPSIYIEDVVRGLADMEPQPDHVAGIVVDETYEIRLAATKPEREDVALPHLVGRGALEKTRTRDVPFGLLSRDRKSTRLNSSH